jgi:hypothetical protein
MHVDRPPGGEAIEPRLRAYQGSAITLYEVDSPVVIAVVVIHQDAGMAEL